MENDNVRQPKSIIPYEVLIIIIVGLFFLLLMFIHCCMQCYKHRRPWSSIRVNSSQPVLPTALTMPQEDDRTHVGNIDVPPDYTVVVEQKSVAANTSDDLNSYPTFAGEKILETPPPAYMTLPPFK